MLAPLAPDISPKYSASMHSELVPANATPKCESYGSTASCTGVGCSSVVFEVEELVGVDGARLTFELFGRIAGLHHRVGAIDRQRELARVRRVFGLRFVPAVLGARVLGRCDSRSIVAVVATAGQQGEHQDERQSLDSITPKQANPFVDPTPPPVDLRVQQHKSVACGRKRFNLFAIL